MSNNLRKILVVGASLFMFVSVGTGTSSMHTNIHAISQTRLKRAYLSKNDTKRIKRAHSHKSHKSIRSYHNRSWKMNHNNKHNSQRASTHYSYRGKRHTSTKYNPSHQYKQGFDVSEHLNSAPITYFGSKFQDNEYYDGLHHSMNKAYKKGFLKGAEKAGRAAAFEGTGLHIYHPKFRRRALKHAHKTAINSLNAWKYSLKHKYNHNFNLGEKAELSLIGNGSSIPKSLKHLKHNRSFKNGWITAYDYTLGVSLKPNSLSNDNYNNYIK